MPTSAIANKELLRVENISFRRARKNIVANCSLQINAGEIVALLGDNGVGKTTLLNLISGALTPDCGKIIFCDEVIAKGFGFLGDKPPIYPRWTVRDLLYFCAQIKQLANSDNLVQQIIIACSLDTVADVACDKLSHGFRKRVGLAQALLNDPPLLLLDEPTNGLDNLQKKTLQQLLLNYSKIGGALLVSHDFYEIVSLASRAYILRDGGCVSLALPPRDGLCWGEFNVTLTSDTKLLRQITPVAPDYLWGRFAAWKCNASREQLIGALASCNDCCGWYLHLPAQALREFLPHVV